MKRNGIFGLAAVSLLALGLLAWSVLAPLGVILAVMAIFGAHVATAGFKDAKSINLDTPPDGVFTMMLGVVVMTPCAMFAYAFLAISIFGR